MGAYATGSYEVTDARPVAHQSSTTRSGRQIASKTAGRVGHNKSQTLTDGAFHLLTVITPERSAPALSMTQQKSALYLVVPEAEVLLNAVRGLPGVALLEPAHVTLAYPWIADPEAHLDNVLAVCAEVLGATVVLHGPECFEQDVRGRTVIYATLSDERVPRDLAARLASPLRTPHLSLARVRRTGDVEQVVATARRAGRRGLAAPVRRTTWRK